MKMTEGLTRGFSLIEVMLAFSILVFCLSGILLTYINLFVFSDLNRDITQITNSLQAKIEDLKRINFDSLSTLNGSTFDIEGFTGTAKGRIEVSDMTIRAVPTETLKRVRVVASFKNKSKLIGEDANLNGQLDPGEDTNNNDRLDSQIEAVTLISR